MGYYVFTETHNEKLSYVRIYGSTIHVACNFTNFVLSFGRKVLCKLTIVA